MSENNNSANPKESATANPGTNPAGKSSSKPRRKRKPRNTDQPRSKRCFIGLAFPLYDALAPLHQDLEALHESAANIRISPAENLHVTLKFLGLLNEEKLPDIKSVAAAICQNFSSMELRCQGIGAFKQSLWVGIEQQPQLTELAEALNQAAQGQGIALDDKEYLPHVTVARLGKTGRPLVSELLERYKAKDWGSFTAPMAHLYLSQTRPEGARYTIIKNFNFKTGDKG